MNFKSTLFLCSLLASSLMIVSCADQQSEAYFVEASEEYSTLTTDYLTKLAAFDFEESYEFLADNVVFQLPDGDNDDRTTFEGKEAVMEFWNNYEEASGNTATVFSDYVHVPINVREDLENVSKTGVFDICYFSAKMQYGEEEANVRMQWSFHFDANKKIDGIYTYYDRTPIIAASKRNILKEEPSKSLDAQPVVQFVRINSALAEQEVIDMAHERAVEFRKLPGLMQKYYVKLGDEGEYGGIYIWDSKASLAQYKDSELAKTIAAAYKVKSKPDVQIMDMLFKLRE